MKKVSLVTPLHNEMQLLQRGLTDIESFIQKFPLEWELILVVDPSHDLTLQMARELKSEKIQIQVLDNIARLGRGPSVRQGLEAATGDYVMIFPLDFTIPLADLFNFLQEVVVNPKLDLVIGNRNTSRKKREAPKKTSWHWTLETIILEKMRSADFPVQDPLCPYLIFQQKSLQRILPKLKLRSWFYTPEIISMAMDEGFQITEVPVLSRDSKPSRIPLVREYLRHLF